MKNDPALIKEINVGSIVQIAPEEDHGTRLRLMVVTKIESWGVSGYVHGTDGGISRTWNLIEPTGGMLVFDPTGKRLTPPKSTAKHHP